MNIFSASLQTLHKRGDPVFLVLLVRINEFINLLKDRWGRLLPQDQLVKVYAYQCRFSIIRPLCFVEAKTDLFVMISCIFAGVCLEYRRSDLRGTTSITIETGFVWTVSACACLGDGDR